MQLSIPREIMYFARSVVSLFMTKLLIIDTYGLIFRAYHAYPPLTTSDGRPTNAIFGFTQMLLNCIEKFTPDFIVCSLESETPTFRHEIDSDYKANRKEVDTELKVQIPEIIKVISRLNIKMLQKNGYEADDVIGSFAVQHQNKFDSIEIVTGDRDLLQLISPKIRIFMPGKKFSDLVEFNEISFSQKFGIEVSDYVLYKSLVGDNSDNIKGIPGIGPKSATEIVKKFHSVEAILANLDELPPRIAETISENQYLLKKYYDLSKIKCDLDIDLTPEDLKVKRMNITALRQILDEYEFKSLGTKIAKFIDKFEKKYHGFDIFDTESITYQSLELEYTLVDYINFEENTAYVIQTSNHQIRLGNGKEFINVNQTEIYNFVILKQLRKFIGFNLKDFIKILLASGIQRIENFEFVDLKLAWHLIKNTLIFDHINELCKYLQITSYPAIYEYTLEQIRTNELANLFEIERKLQIILALMEFEGIHCDKTYLSQLAIDYKTQIDHIKKQIFDFVGHEFNPASTKELGHILFEVLKLPVIKKTKTGYSTDDSTLTKLEGLSEIIPLIKKFRLYSKTLSTYIIGLQDNIDTDGKIHTTYLQDHVATGRLSSINPNLQNLPADEEIGKQIKKAFQIPKGIFLSIDYSQIDLRVLAHESKDERLIEAFLNDEDIHTATAKLIFDKQKITKEERQYAKRINFGIVYGMEAYGLAQALNITPEAAKEFIEKYFEKFPGVRRYFNRILQELDEKGYVHTILNRKRFFDNWKSASGMQKKALFREAINMPIQGGSSDIMKIGMIKVFDFINENNINAKLLLQIHDELIFAIEDESNLDKYLSQFSQIMENAYKLDVPLKVSYKVGKDLSFSSDM